MISPEGARHPREARPAQAPTVLDLLGNDWDVDQAEPGFSWKRLRAGRRLGARQLGASVYLLPPGQRSFPFHFHHANEELLLVLEGEVAVRTADGELTVRPGQLMLFERGPEGAHQLINRSGSPARLLLISGMQEPEITGFPDTGKFGLFAGGAPGATSPGDFKRFVAGAEVGYFDGEPNADDDTSD